MNQTTHEILVDFLDGNLSPEERSRMENDD